MSNITFQQIPNQLMACMLHTEQYINSLHHFEKSTLELMRYYVSTLNNCAYCIDMHFKEAIAEGETAQRLSSVKVWRETPYYSKAEQALLAWTEVVTILDQKSEARAQHFMTLKQFYSLEDIANLTLAITQINSWNRLAKAFGFEAGTYQVGDY